MWKPRMIRLVIYLIISIGLVIFILNIPDKKQIPEKGKVNPKKEMNDSVIEIEVPQTDSLKFENIFTEIEIDSLSNLIFKNESISLIELQKEIRVQIKKEPKLFLKILVHPSSKSEILMALVEFASKEKVKIGITKKE